MPYAVERRPLDIHGISRRRGKAGEGGGNAFRARLKAVGMRGAKLTPGEKKKTIDRLLGEFGGDGLRAAPGSFTLTQNLRGGELPRAGELLQFIR